MVLISGLGRQRIKYPDPKTCEFETNPQKYIKIAKKIVNYFASSEVAREILHDEDAISFIAEHIMYADWRWTPKRGRTQRAYRNQCGIWAIKVYISTKNRKNKYKMLSLNSLIGPNKDMSAIDTIINKDAPHGIEISISTEDDNRNKALVNEILNSKELSERESEFLRLRFIEGMTCAAIGIIHNITRERVRQVLDIAMNKIREVYEI